MADKDAIEEIMDALRGPLLAWALGGVLAIFMSFIIGVLRWTYEGPSFGYRYDILALLGVWLLCFWSVSFVLRILSKRNG